MKSSWIGILVFLFCNVIYASPVAPSCERIIAISPTVTETLRDLGLNKYIIGGTRYDIRDPLHPHADIGGMLDPNYEKIITLKPTIIFAQLNRKSSQIRRLEQLNLPHQELDFDSMNAIISSMKSISDVCGIQASTAHFIDQFKESIVMHKVADPTPQSVLIFYGDAEDIRAKPPIYAAGKSFHSEMLAVLGAKNSYEGTLNAVTLSQEAILMMNPDVIIILNNADKKGANEVTPFMPDWRLLQSVNALKNKKVFLIEGDDAFMSSPNAVLRTLARFRRILRIGNDEIQENRNN